MTNLTVLDDIELIQLNDYLLGPGFRVSCLLVLS